MFIGRTVRYVLIGVVSTMWVFNLVAPIFLDTYKPDPSVNAIFMIVIGALFGGDAISKFKKTDQEPPRKEADGD